MSSAKRHWIWLILAAGLLLAAVRATERPGRAEEPSPPAAATTTAAAPSLDLVAALGVPNARMSQPRLVTAGQPTPEQFRQLVGLGFRTFISLRPAEEEDSGWEEAEADDEDVMFARVAVAGALDLTHENVEALARLLEGAGDGPVVLYCGSGNRAGAMLALKAHWLDGMSPEEALALGRAAGMTRLEPEVAALLGAPGG